MKLKLFIIIVDGLFLSYPSFAQELKNKPQQFQSRTEQAATPSGVREALLFKSIDHNTQGDKWAISVRNRTSREHAMEQLAAIKEEKLIIKQKSVHLTDTTETQHRAVVPKIATNFEANWSLESTPPDNTLAISNGGYIVSANNDGIEYYTATGNHLYFDYWIDFFDDNALSASFFDPKVIYDSGSDRFVMIVLHGSAPLTTKVLVCFSKTNNPQNGWWVYTLTGNPLNNTCWFDYPSLGVSNNEIYVTGNLFKGQAFQQAIIYQISKAEGYAGESLDWQYWYDLDANPFVAFALVPASYGHQGNYGPGIYFVSSQSIGEQHIKLWDLTDDMSGSPVMESYSIATEEYSPSGDAYQSGSDEKLDNGDCRMLQAFYLNGIIHFVFNTDIGEGWNGICYNRLEASNLNLQTSTFGLKGSYDFSYPSVAAFSINTTDQSVMIAFLRSSSNTFPQCRVVNCDHDMNWSPSTLVKSGETFIDFLGGDERWGDYTGMSRKHNSPEASVWMAGCYGADIQSQFVFNSYKTWIAEVLAGTTVQVETETAGKTFTLFPNPVYDIINIQFEITALEEITIGLYTLDGQQLKLLYRDTPKVGIHHLRFNKGVLLPGTYIVSIQTPTQILKNEKVVVVE